MKIQQKYLLRCIQIARSALGTAAPNPMVGCVIVHDDRIIGEGFTSPYGGPHAEVNAIHSVTDKTLLPSSVLYVSLEPCSHHGKTPPCVDLILQHRIPVVVIGVTDPNEQVAGEGIAKLRAHGCEVHTEIAERECRYHHRRFLTFHQKKRPYIILKWAQTMNGLIAPDPTLRKGDPRPFWITNSVSRQRTHQWRSEEQAILVGTTTILEDNPQLDVRDWKGRNPLRIGLDRRLKVPAEFHIFDDRAPTLLLTEVSDQGRYQDGIAYRTIDFALPLAEQICQALHAYDVQSVLVEGGAQTLQTFLSAGLWDEARVFTGQTIFDGGVHAPQFAGRPEGRERLDGDLLNYYTHDSEHHL